MRIAVVGDVHGHLELMYAILGRWQRESGRSLDLILQVGDLGAFHPGAPLDHATKRHAESDPEELGFGEFAGDSPPATLLDPRPLLVFVPGNHEDFEYLTRCEASADPADPLYAVSRDGRIRAIRSGRVWSFQVGDQRLIRVAGVSGVAGRAQKKHLHPRLHLREEDAVGIAAGGRGAVDILISHERPAGNETRFRRDLGGSPALRQLIQEVQPAFACFGHYDRPTDYFLGTTRVLGLGSCGYHTFGEWPVKPNGIVLVEWSLGGVAMEWLKPGWLAGATRAGWREW